MTPTPVLYEAAFRLPADRAWELLRDPVAMSRTALRAVVGPEHRLSRVEANLLWRADPRRSAETTDVVLRTTVPIDESLLLDRWHPIRPVTRVPLAWEEGQKIMFCLTGNPATRRAGSSSAVPIKDPAKQEAWLRHQCAPALELPTLHTTRRPPIRSEARGAVFCRAEFAGIGVVTDPEAFARLIINGVGRSKSYGFGMLRVLEHPAATAAPLTGERELVGAAA